MPDNKMDVIHLHPHHITDIKELKINGENVTSIAEQSDNIVYVSKNGSDETGNGSLGNPFLTIETANNHAISLVNAVTDWDEHVIVQVFPGFYTEKLTQAHRRVWIIGMGKDFENWPKTTIYNTGADADHYPIDVDYGLNLSDLRVKVDSGGIFGKIINKGLYSLCVFEGGYFIDNSDSTIGLTTYYNHCLFEGDAFKFEGTNDRGMFIALRNCDMYDGTNTIFGTSGTGERVIKIQDTMIGNPLNINGNWSLESLGSELYTNGSITFDTDGSVDIFSSIIENGIHFTTDTALTKKLVNCLFRNITADQGDVTADVPVEFIEYSGNHQDHGIDGEIITVSKIKNVGGGQNMYRNIHEALQGSTLQDTIINLEGDVTITEPLVIPANVDIQIDGNKKWKLTSTHATTLTTLGVNQALSFVNMKQIIGGKLAIVNGDSATLSFVSCGRYTNPNYVNVQINAGNGSSCVYFVKTTLIGTGAPGILISDIDPCIICDRSFIQGASGEPAIEWTVDADSKSKFKYSTFLHGDGAGNSPFLNSDPGNGDITFSIYDCALNASYPANDFTNSINPLNANLTVDSGIDY